MRHPNRAIPGLQRAVIAAMMSAAVACGPFRRGSNDQPPAILYFTNESLDAADIFAVTAAGQRVRLGTVFAGRTDTLVVPRDIITGQNLNLFARVLARSVMPQSGPVAIHSGDTLQVRLPIDLKVLVVLPAQQ